MKCCPKGWAPALLVALQLLHLGDAAHMKRKQPEGNLRAALQSRTEELTQEKNIAHGLELEVRELQTDLAAAKKALVTETQKEHTVSDKLNTVRSVLGLDGGATPSSNAVVAEAPPATQVAPAAPVAQTSRVEVPPPAPVPVPVVKVSSYDAIEDEAASLKVVKVSKPVPQAAPLMPIEEAALIPDDSDMDSPEELAAQQAYGLPAEPPAPKRKAPAAPIQRKAPAAPVQRKVVKDATRAVREAVKAVSAANHRAYKKAPVARQQKRQARLAPVPVAVEPLRETPAAQSAALMTNSAVITKDSSAVAGGDFDALEAQLHEEDRRIQDLDSENNLDALSDGGSPSQPSLKTQPAQPKLELDAEAPMEDLLNVDAPESQGADAFPADGAVALPQVSEAVQTGLEGAESDNQFLAQFSPSAKRG